MEIRTLQAGELDPLIELLSGWDGPGGWRDGDFFRRRLEVDPGFREQNVWLALERGRPVACVQIFPRRLRILGHAIPSGLIATSYTRPEYRGRGLSTSLVESAATAMRERGIELAVVFSDRGELFHRLGWRAWKGVRSILRKAGDAAGANPGDEGAGIELVSFEQERARALPAVKAIHAAYSGSRSGTVIRDDALWESSLALAGHPREEFWIARRGGLAVAYARAALLDEGLSITELGRFEDGAAALGKLIASLLEPRDADVLAPAGSGSQEIRSFALMPTFDDIGLTVGLEHLGISTHSIDDTSGLVRCLNATALAARLDVELLPGEDEITFLRRILPPDGFVFWPSDRL